jgi:hypothetical protein
MKANPILNLRVAAIQESRESASAQHPEGTRIRIHPEPNLAIQKRTTLETWGVELQREGKPILIKLSNPEAQETID